MYYIITIMRLVVQRVKKAKVIRIKDKRIVGSIERGLFVLLGVKKGDTVKEAQVLADRLVKLRVMADSSGKMNLSVKDVGGKILVVSQFTLFADTSAGNRPSFMKAASPKKAEEIYDFFISHLKERGVGVASGSFGDYMQIEAFLDGPVTILLEK
jgi:D-tyrosyl-tRNA(Tyr) deacylase